MNNDNKSWYFKHLRYVVIILFHLINTQQSAQFSLSSSGKASD